MVEWYAGRYQANLAVSLKKYGLRYDDLYDPRMDLVSSKLSVPATGVLWTVDMGWGPLSGELVGGVFAHPAGNCNMREHHRKHLPRC